MSRSQDATDPKDRRGEPHLEAAPPGLRGLAVADMELGQVRGAEGFYHYRQYDAIELAENRTFEDVWHLFTECALPFGRAARAVRSESGRSASTPEDVSGLLPEVARLPAASPLSAERIGMSLVSAALQLRPALDCSPRELRNSCLQLCALAPSVVAAMHRLRSGSAPKRACGASRARCQLPVHVEWGGGRRGPGEGARAVLDRHDRPRIQRLDVHRHDNRLHQGRNRGGHRGAMGERASATPSIGPKVRGPGCSVPWPSAWEARG